MLGGSAVRHPGVGNRIPRCDLGWWLLLGKPRNPAPVDAWADGGHELTPASGRDAHEPPMADLVVEEWRALLREAILPPDGFRNHVSICVEPSEKSVGRRLPSEVLGQDGIQR